MAPELKARIDELVTSNKIVVFMKGTKQFPQCGFSNTVVQARGAHAAACGRRPRMRRGGRGRLGWGRERSAT